MGEREPRPGDVVGARFSLQHQLGSGGFGTVWLAKDEDTQGTRVALKLLHPQHKKNTRILDRFVREAQLLEDLDHPNLARPIGWSVEGEHAYIGMEYVDGVALDQDMTDHAAASPYTPEEVLEIVGGIAGAISYAHQRNIVHRDLKPRNVMLVRKDGRIIPKVLDFGVAKILADGPADSTTVGRIFGSLLYMSPEQARGFPVDHRIDVFALGSILFELLTLRRAWARDEADRPLTFRGAPIRREPPNDYVSITTRLIGASRPRPTEFRPDLPAALDRVVQKALAIDREARFDSAVELAEATRAAFSGESELGPVEPQEIAEHTRVADTMIAPMQLSSPTDELSRVRPRVSTPSAPPVGAGQRTPSRPTPRVSILPEVPRPTELSPTPRPLSSDLRPPPRRNAPIGVAVALSAIAVGLTIAGVIGWNSKRPDDTPSATSLTPGGDAPGIEAFARSSSSTRAAHAASPTEPVATPELSPRAPGIERHHPDRAHPARAPIAPPHKQPGRGEEPGHEEPAPAREEKSEKSGLAKTVNDIQRRFDAAKKEESSFRAIPELSKRMSEAAGQVADPDQRTAIKACIVTATQNLGDLEECLLKLKSAAR